MGIRGATPESLARLFRRFLRFGFLAFGGPVSQIAMMYEELVEREHWTSPRQFNRVLGVYQALPGPEAAELAIYFGYARRGRLGGLVAGLGFALPGFFLMLLASWAYVEYGAKLDEVKPFVHGIQAVVIGILLHALLRIGQRAYTSPLSWGIGVVALTVSVLWSPSLALVALGGGIIGLLARGGLSAKPSAGAFAPVLLALPWAGMTAWSYFGWFFLQAGLLTFGGAYTVLPFLQEGAVEGFGWLTNEQFLDGIALGGLLPAPLIIVATFVGYLAGGFPGAVVATVFIFLPAFLFTLMGYRFIVRLVEEPKAHGFFDGVTAAVVALIALVAYRLAPAALPDAPAALIALSGFLALRVFRAPLALVIAGGGLVGAALRAFVA